MIIILSLLLTSLNLYLYIVSKRYNVLINKEVEELKEVIKELREEIIY